jgi:hypothetical protein
MKHESYVFLEGKVEVEVEVEQKKRRRRKMEAMRYESA